MEIGTTTHIIQISRGKDSQKIPLIAAIEDKKLISCIRDAFKGRLFCPQTLAPQDGVKLILKKYDRESCRIKFLLSIRIYNKSVRQVRIETEKAIKAL